MTESLYSLTDLEICQRLAQCFAKEIPQHDIPGANPVWTKRVKAALGCFAVGCGLRTQYTGAEAEGSLSTEYLCDVMIWSQQSWSLQIAAEIEWNQGPAKLREDFRKLLVIKAPVKLFICDLGDDPESRAREVCEVELQAYADHLPGERYLVLNLCGNPTIGGSIRAYAWRVPDDPESPVRPALTPVSNEPIEFYVSSI